MENDIICAIATGVTDGAISIIRVSGKGSIKICNKFFYPLKKDFKLSIEAHQTITTGKIYSGNYFIDKVMIAVFRSPESYTGEESIEIYCHASSYICSSIINLLIDNGVRVAKPGEFTRRAFLNSKIDLTQAEAVADLIASNSQASHKIAISGMRGNFSKELSQIRENLLKFTSLIELELDFSEEDVQFADRTELTNLINNIIERIKILRNSFKIGNSIKNGIPVVIAGEPNVGKSTLLNVLLEDEFAIVSEIPGTTRDTLEDTISIEGILFRFIDTAGIRNTFDTIEKLGIKRTFDKIEKAEVVLYILDINSENYINQIEEFSKKYSGKKIIFVLNKSDIKNSISNEVNINYPHVLISAKNKKGIENLKNILLETINYRSISETSLVANARHYDLLTNAEDALCRVKRNIAEKISGEFISQDIHIAMKHLGEITGEITNDEVLGNIFKNFCIGK